LHEQLVKETGTMPRTPKQEELLAAARKSQEIMVDAIRTWAETVRTATPRLSSAYAQYAERLPKVPSVSVPLAGQLPRPQEAVASAFDLAERLLASQRKFAEDVVKVTRPLMPGFGVSKPEDRGRTEPQDRGDGAIQDHSEVTSEDRGETAPQETTPQETTPQETTPQETTPQETTPQETTPQETMAEKAPKATTAKGTTKITAAPRAPKTTAAGRAQKSAAPRRAPKATDAG
jgi:hypothetical protein